MKVYVVEYGAYSDRYIDCVFTTRELAETYVIEKARRSWSALGGPFPERGSLSFDQWSELADDGWGSVGDVREYDLWDMVPIADLAKNAVTG